MYQGKSVLVVGAAKSGVAAARFLAEQGAKVTITDQKKGEALASAKQQLSAWPITWEEGGNNPKTAQDAHFVVVSPGVPSTNIALTAAQEAKISVIGEVELAYQNLKGPMVAITGSNGKSTTTMLVGEMLKFSNKKTFVGGNIGTPLIEAANQTFDAVVAEISSFQMEWVKDFQPKVAAILNISPNHLDRHASFEEYRDLKLKLLSQVAPGGVAIWNANDPVLAEHCPKVSTGKNAKTFSLSYQEGADAWVADGFFHLKFEGKVEQYSISQVKLRGKHNHENILAALLLARYMGATPEGINQALSSFAGLAHRLEHVAVIDGVEYINDSKATSVAATVCALEAFPEETKLILLAGGKDKGGSYSPLAGLAKQRCKAVIVFGEAKHLIQAALASSTQVFMVEDISQAAHKAKELASAGDVVLLAPACSSYDQFPNFEVRGDTFRSVVRALS
jgi:UDP-N-acetylmuramoylalanine--D-glutamate ligase